jgi:hypothetical protein
MRIEGLGQYQRRGEGVYFEDLPWETQRAAEYWLARFCERWGQDLPHWRLAILVGQAKRLALNPPDSAWGRRMLAKRGGYAVQRLYRQHGRVGRFHPALRAASVSASGRRWRKRQREEAKERRRLGLPPPPRVWNTMTWDW